MEKRTRGWRYAQVGLRNPQGEQSNAQEGTEKCTGRGDTTNMIDNLDWLSRDFL